MLKPPTIMQNNEETNKIEQVLAYGWEEEADCYRNNSCIGI